MEKFRKQMKALTIISTDRDSRRKILPSYCDLHRDWESTYYLLKWLLEVRPENTEWNIFKKVEERKKLGKENEDYKN